MGTNTDYTELLLGDKISKTLQELLVCVKAGSLLLGSNQGSYEGDSPGKSSTFSHSNPDWRMYMTLKPALSPHMLARR